MPTKRRVRMDCGELENVDVLRISLVDRGANRVPFRFTKRDNPGEGNHVLDFNLPFRKAERQIEVGAVVLSGDADLEQDRKVIEEAGFTVEGMVEDEDGNRIFPQVEDLKNAPGQAFLKLDECRGVVLLNAAAIQKQFAESVDFSENFGAAQFLPGLDLATSTLFKTVMTILEEADNRDATVRQIQEATEAAKSAIDGLAAAIPENVFKLERAFAAGGEPEPDKPAKKADEKSAEGKDEKAQKAQKAEDEKDEKDEGAQAAKKQDESGDGSDEQPEATRKAEDVTEKVLEAVAGLSKKIETLGEQVDGVSKRVEAAEKAAGKAATAVDKHEQALAAVGVVDPGDSPRVNGERQRARKSARVPLIDTARTRPE